MPWLWLGVSGVVMVVVFLCGLAIGIAVSDEPASRDEAAGAPGAESTTRTQATTSTPTTVPVAPPTPVVPMPTVPNAPPAGPADAVPLGTPQRVGDFTVTVNEFVVDAEHLIDGDYGDPPPVGERHVVVVLSATYDGDEEGDPYSDLTVGYLGADGRLYKDTNCYAWLVDDMADEPELAPGGTATGGYCVVVPDEVVGTGAVFVEGTYDFSGRRAWWTP